MAETPSLARIAYEAYKDAVGGRSVHGEELPYFGALDETVVAGWSAAAAAVAEAATTR